MTDKVYQQCYCPSSMKRGLVFILFVLSVFTGSFYAQAESRPNIILFLTDDQHWADLTEEIMPQTLERIFKPGVTFTNAFVTTPWCCPSRASIFTGKYAYRHGVKNNDLPLKGRTVIHDLQDAGYFTGIIGKYLNSWGGSHRKEYDFWRVFSRGNTKYLQPRFNENGKWKAYKRHIAEVYKEYMTQFFEESAASDKPFVLFFTPNLPHRPAKAEEKYKQLFQDLPYYMPENASCEHRRGKPRWVRKARCQRQAGLVKVKKRAPFQLRQRQVLRSFDDIVGIALDALKENQQLSNTAVFFLSDNGLLRLSFGLIGKPFGYEDAIRVPFGFLYPPVTSELSSRERSPLVANIDITATIYELSKVTPPAGLDGRSLLPLVADAAVPWRDHLLFEGYFLGQKDKLQRTSFAGIRTLTHTLLVNQLDKPELYNMQDDYWQKENIVFDKPELSKALFRKLLKYRPEVANKTWIEKPQFREVFDLKE